MREHHLQYQRLQHLQQLHQQLQLLLFRQDEQQLQQQLKKLLYRKIAVATHIVVLIYASG